MNNKQKFLAEALLILAGSCVALPVQAQTSSSTYNQPASKSATAQTKKEDCDRRKFAKGGKQAERRANKQKIDKNEEPANVVFIEYGGGG